MVDFLYPDVKITKQYATGEELNVIHSTVKIEEGSVPLALHDAQRL